MGIPVNTVFDIIEKVRAWVVGRVNDSQEQLDSDISHSMCCECKTQLMDFSIKGVSVVKSDGRGNTDKGEQRMKLCKYCEHKRKFDHSASGKLRSDNIKSFQSDHLLRFLEANRLSTNSSVASSADDLSPLSFTRSSSRSDDEEDMEDSGKHFLSLSRGYYRGISDIDSCSVSDRHEFLSLKSVGSSPFDSPSRITPRSGSSVHLEQEGSPVSLNDASLRQERLANSKRPETECDDNETTDYGSDDLSVFRDQFAEVKQPFDFESNGLVWLPPPPDDADAEAENSFFEYDDEDDDVGESGMIFGKSNISSDIFPAKVKSNEEQKEPLRAVVHGHFRALVLQLLQGEDIYVENEDKGQGWLNIVTSLAWQAANFVKPDTKSGGSMDPGNYVKIKCIESGSPSESTFIKGVVCTKNIKHKRMTSQYRNPRLFLLGGSLEYQRASNQLASFDTLLQQEIDHLKLIVSKIEAHRPNVLLVEKSVSSYAQEYLLAKDISLVLNVKRSLLERVARCTGAHIVPSMDKISSARLGNCEGFRLERIVEDCSVAHLPNKKSTKTLMFFEGCPRRLGCTVLLRGAHSELLKKVKRVMHYAVFAAYHLSLETSFLADEGATLLKMPLISPVSCPEGLMNLDVGKSMISNQSIQDELSTVEGQCEDLCECSLSITSSFGAIVDVSASNDRSVKFTVDDNNGSSYLSYSSDCVRPSHTVSMESRNVNAYLHASNTDLVPNVAQGTCHHSQCKDRGSFSRVFSNHELAERSVLEEESIVRHQSESTYGNELTRNEGVEANGVISEYLAVDNHPSILVSFSSHCVLKGTLCERSQLLRIKFYSSFDKPLGRYLQDDLFDQTAYCRSCKESTDAHVRCYIHQQGSLSINVRRLFKVELPGRHEGKIWMWHRCLKCAYIDGVPPANRRVLMSDAAWGLSFGKFLELSFSNHATANRVASCGHSLQRDCLRFYGYGSMVAFFRYSPIDILSVRLPPSMLEFDGRVQQEWVKREAIKLYNEMEVLYAEVFDALQSIEEKSSFRHANLDEDGFHNHITDLKALLKKERNEYKTLLHPVGMEDPHYWEDTLDILELNRLRRCLLMDSYIWDHRLYSLESLSKNKALIQRIDPHLMEVGTYDKLKQWRDESFFKNTKLSYAPEENRMAWTVSENPKNHLMSEGKEEHCFSIMDSISKELTEEQLIKKSVESYYGSNTELASDPRLIRCDCNVDYEVPVDERPLGSIPSPASYLSDKFDSVWTGTAQNLTKPQDTHISQPENKQFGTVSIVDLLDSRSRRLLKSPMRVHSFDSAMTIQEKIRQGLSPSLQMSSLRSFHASGEFSSMIRDPVPSILRTLSQTSSREAQKLSFIFNTRPLIISSASNLAREGVRLLLPQTGHKNIVVPVCDDEPTSAVSYVLCSKEYEDWITDKLVDHGVSKVSESNREDELNPPGFYSATSTLSAFHSFASLESEDIFFRNHLSNDASAAITSMFSDQKKSLHFSTTFEDEYSSSQGKVKFSVICYYGRQFDTLRKMCCPSEVDFIRSLSRCSRWNAQGGKSNVYFAKSLDERFIVKQVTKTELDSFEEFAPQYFKYLMDSLSTGSPTCLAKVLGIYQVTVRHPKSGKQTKMDLMVMENLFFRRNISRVYDLKGSARSRYNADTTGKDKVLLDMNLLETLRTRPIFLGSKAKRSLERAVWNDTSFLASIDVMDYSLLVGVDDEGKELVLGIIDFMRQYTWDKHLETWVKASGILGGPKNTSPTVVSPMQYKKRFRKAMTTYFLTVPDQWSCEGLV